MGVRRGNQIVERDSNVEPGKVRVQFLKKLLPKFPNDLSKNADFLKEFLPEEECKAIIVLVARDGTKYAKKIYFPGDLVAGDISSPGNFKQTVLQAANRGLMIIRIEAVRAIAKHNAIDATKSLSDHVFGAKR